MKTALLLLVCLLIYPANAQIQIQAVSRGANRVLIFTKRPEIWSLHPWRRLLTINAPVSADSLSPAVAALSRDRKLVALGRENGTIELFETYSGRLWKRLGKPEVGHPNPKNNFQEVAVTAVAFSSGRGLLASGSDKGVFVWRVRDGKLLFSRPLLGGSVIDGHPFTPHRVRPEVMQFSPDGRTLAVGGGFDSLHLFDVARKRERLILPFQVEDGGAEAIAFAPTGKQLFVASYWNVSGGSYNQYHLFDTRNGRIIWTQNTMELNQGKFIVGEHDPTDAAAFASNGRFIAVGGPRFLEIRRARDGKRLKRQVVTYPQDEAPDPNFARERRFRAELAVR